MTAWSVIGIAGGVSGVLLLFGLLIRNPKDLTKWILFVGISIPVLAASGFLVVDTVWLNITSATKGPVHWHADLLLYHCGKEIGLKNPTGLSNRIGTPLLHEHGDKRIHVEGVVKKLDDVSLKHFFEAVGGDFTETSIAIPINESLLILSDGQTCPNGTIGKLQTFVNQRKIEDGPAYVLSPFSQVPPGDCIVVEFGPERETTERTCTRL